MNAPACPGARRSSLFPSSQARQPQSRRGLHACETTTDVTRRATRSCHWKTGTKFQNAKGFSQNGDTHRADVGPPTRTRDTYSRVATTRCDTHARLDQEQVLMESEFLVQWLLKPIQKKVRAEVEETGVYLVEEGYLNPLAKLEAECKEELAKIDRSGVKFTEWDYSGKDTVCSKLL
uniref:Uncharacterized protein n=1 Tax=Leersia perrieri TaxID=77586 RepID=A0A0D9XTY4_9ORYZ